MHHGTALLPVAIALYGLYVCHSQYTPVAPQFLSGKRTFASSLGAPDVGESAQFLAVFPGLNRRDRLASGFSYSQTESTPARGYPA